MKPSPSAAVELTVHNLVHDLAAHLFYNFRHDEDWPIRDADYEDNIIMAEFKDGQKFKITVEKIDD